MLEGLGSRDGRDRRHRRRCPRQPRRDAARRAVGGRHREPAADDAARGSRPAGRGSRNARRQRRAATLHRIITSGDNAFVRIMRSIAGYYLLGVEARPRDRDGRRHRIQVKTTRRGVTVVLAPRISGDDVARERLTRRSGPPRAARAADDQRPADAHGDVDLQGAGRVARQAAARGRGRTQRRSVARLHDRHRVRRSQQQGAGATPSKTESCA